MQKHCLEIICLNSRYLAKLPTSFTGNMWVKSAKLTLKRVTQQKIDEILTVTKFNQFERVHINLITGLSDKGRWEASSQSEINLMA